jgi:hypothetical protein
VQFLDVLNPLFNLATVGTIESLYDHISAATAARRRRVFAVRAHVEIEHSRIRLTRAWLIQYSQAEVVVNVVRTRNLDECIDVTHGRNVVQQEWTDDDANS